VTDKARVLAMPIRAITTARAINASSTDRICSTYACMRSPELIRSLEFALRIALLELADRKTL